MTDIHIWGGVPAIAGTVVAVVALIVLHLLPTGVHPVRDPVSQYRITRFAPWSRVALVAELVAAVGVIVALIGLTGQRSVAAVVLTGLFVVAWVSIAFAPMDPPGGPTTARGRLHSILAITGFGALTAAAFVAGGALHDAGHGDAATWSTVFGVVMAVGAVGLLLAVLGRARALFGLFERIIYVGLLAWFALVGAAALCT